MIRAAQPADLPVILQLVKELATYERVPDNAVATEADFHAALFGPDAVAGCQLAELDGRVVGMALWFRSFSTWLGKPGLWLEDLFVREEARGTGLGKALLVSLAQICVDNGWARFEWWVLDWNEPAQGFYRSIGARPEDEWTVWRLDGDALAALAVG